VYRMSKDALGIRECIIGLRSACDVSCHKAIEFRSLQDCKGGGIGGNFGANYSTRSNHVTPQKLIISDLRISPVLKSLPFP